MLHEDTLVDTELLPDSHHLVSVGRISEMASSKRPNSMEDLFKKQDREILADTITYGSGGISFKGNASDALSLLNQLRFEGEGGFCDMICYSFT